MIMPTISFKKTVLNYNDTGLLNNLISDYLTNAKKVRPYYQYTPDINAFKSAIDNRQKFPLFRQQLSDTLKLQNKLYLEDYTLIKENIDLLKEKNTFTVTTGHQLCIFTGPLYYIYKIISTINLAEALKEKYPDYHFVPVYWLSGEDHDFEEINHIHLFNKKLVWQQNVSGPAGKLSTDSMTQLLAELKEVMGVGAPADELYKLFEEAYLFNASLSDATRFLVNRLFGKYGLVVCDGDTAELKKLFLPVIKDELNLQKSVSLVEATTVALSKDGYKPQVNPRNINLFYMEEGLRERIVLSSNGNYTVLNTELIFTHEEILKLADEHPEKFSPNVVLRPMYQECILPNLAYVGGPGELAYWLQYRSLFEESKIHYPVLILRSGLLWMDAKSMKKWRALNLTITDLLKSLEELVALYINKLEEDKFDFENEKLMLHQLFDTLKSKVIAIDKSLEGSVAAELQKTLNALDALHKKTNAAFKRKHDTSLTQLKSIREKVFPDGVFQERHLNFIPYYLQTGGAFIEIVKNNLKPLDFSLTVIEEAD